MRPNPRLRPVEYGGRRAGEWSAVGIRARSAAAARIGRRPIPPAHPGCAAPTLPSRSGDSASSVFAGTPLPAGPARVADREPKVCDCCPTRSLSGASPGTRPLSTATGAARAGPSPLRSFRAGAPRGSRRSVSVGSPEHSAARPDRRRERRQRRGDALQTVSGAVNSRSLHRHDGPKSHRVEVLEASPPRIVPRAPGPAFRAEQPLVVTLDFDQDFPAFGSKVHLDDPPRRLEGQNLGEELLAVHHRRSVLPSRTPPAPPRAGRRLPYAAAESSEGVLTVHAGRGNAPGPASDDGGAESRPDPGGGQSERAAKSGGMGRASSR